MRNSHLSLQEQFDLAEEFRRAGEPLPIRGALSISTDAAFYMNEGFIVSQHTPRPIFFFLIVAVLDIARCPQLCYI